MLTTADDRRDWHMDSAAISFSGRWHGAVGDGSKRNCVFHLTAFSVSPPVTQLFHTKFR